MSVQSTASIGASAKCQKLRKNQIGTICHKDMGICIRGLRWYIYYSVHTQQSYGNMRHLYRTVIRRAVIAISLLCLLVFVCLQNLMTVTVFNSMWRFSCEADMHNMQSIITLSLPQIRFITVFLQPLFLFLHHPLGTFWQTNKNGTLFFDVAADLNADLRV